jgi:hypothetical protein
MDGDVDDDTDHQPSQTSCAGINDLSLTKGEEGAWVGDPLPCIGAGSNRVGHSAAHGKVGRAHR